MRALSLFTMTLIIAGAAHAQRASTLASGCEEMCRSVTTYDDYASRACYVVNGHMTVKEPSETVSRALRLLAPTIRRYARVFGVDPRAIVSSILTENSLNVSIDDRVQNLLATMESRGLNLGGISERFTVGWGQLYLPAAMEAEINVVAPMEGREPLSREDLQAELLVPERAMKYAAAVNAFNQRTYRECGYNISRDIHILATLYNLGHATRRCEETRQSGREPRPNFFGAWAHCQRDIMDSIANHQLGSGGRSQVEIPPDTGNMELLALNLQGQEEYNADRVRQAIAAHSMRQNLARHQVHADATRVVVRQPGNVTIGSGSIPSNIPGFGPATAVPVNEEVKYLSVRTAIRGYNFPQGCLSANNANARRQNIVQGDVVLKIKDRKRCGNEEWMLVATARGVEAWTTMNTLTESSQLIESEQPYSCSRSWSSCWDYLSWKNEISEPNETSGTSHVNISGSPQNLSSDACTPVNQEQLNAAKQRLKTFLHSCRDNDLGDYLIISRITEIEQQLDEMSTLDLNLLASNLPGLAFLCSRGNNEQLTVSPALVRVPNICSELQLIAPDLTEEVVNMQYHRIIVAMLDGEGANGSSALIVDELEALKAKLTFLEGAQNECHRGNRTRALERIEVLSSLECVKRIRTPFLSIARASGGKVVYDPTVEEPLTLDLGVTSCSPR